mgnify:CR=1 FL=1
MMKAVVLLSGGLDSATVAAIARQQGFEPCAISFRYGHSAMRSSSSTRGAWRPPRHTHVTVEFDLRKFGGSALTADIVRCPRGARHFAMGKGIPVTYVPARNTIFWSFALAYAETLGANDIFVGVNALDYSGYPTAGRSTSQPMRRWRISLRKPASRARAAEDPHAADQALRPTSSGAA